MSTTTAPDVPYELTGATLAGELDDDGMLGAPDAEADVAAGPGGGQPENYYPDVYAFVAGFWAPTFAHDVAEIRTSWRWCSHWFHHAEALARLEACWKAWEVLRRDPGTGASLWFRDHADPCLAALTASDGPFSRCSDTTHKLPKDLPTAPLPAGLGTSSNRL